ncbi:hypothetical protein H8959_003966 [Pygathrix nigripes]
MSERKEGRGKGKGKKKERGSGKKPESAAGSQSPAGNAGTGLLEGQPVPSVCLAAQKWVVEEGAAWEISFGVLGQRASDVECALVRLDSVLRYGDSEQRRDS